MNFVSNLVKFFPDKVKLFGYIHCLIEVRAKECIAVFTAAQIDNGTDTKTVPASKIKGQCTGDTPYTLILANRPRSVSNVFTV